MLNHKDSDDNNFWKYSELSNQIITETNTKQRWQTHKKAPINSGSIYSKVPTTDKKVKYRKKPKATTMKWIKKQNDSE